LPWPLVPGVVAVSLPGPVLLDAEPGPAVAPVVDEPLAPVVAPPLAPMLLEPEPAR
jgi:hypothetical protein